VDPDGRIVYSDEPQLVGARYRVDAEERAALAAGKVEPEVSDLSRPENRFERGQRTLLEVYLPIRGPDGQRLRFEAYHRFSSISVSGRRLWLAFAPALLGGLLLLQLVNLPLARSMVRRLRDAQAQRELMLRRAIDASDLERRRIAADLHDGVVQDLVGVSYELAAQAERAEISADPMIAAAASRSKTSTPCSRSPTTAAASIRSCSSRGPPKGISGCGCFVISSATPAAS
jgi:two-component system, NarL family, sensor kinase